ncbi:hypothetical protein ACFX2J_014855 [Malus domestica]
MTNEEKQSLNPNQVQPVACKEFPCLLGMGHMHRRLGVNKPRTWKSNLDQYVKTRGSQELCYLSKGKSKKS